MGSYDQVLCYPLLFELLGFYMSKDVKVVVADVGHVIGGRAGEVVMLS